VAGALISLSPRPIMGGALTRFIFYIEERSMPGKSLSFMVLVIGVAVGIPVFAEELQNAADNSVKPEWVKAGENGAATIYFDSSTISREGNIVKMSKLVDYPTPPVQNFTKPFKSFKVQIEFDCKEGNSRRVSDVFYADNMGKGEAVLTEKIDEGWSMYNLNDPLFKNACTKNSY
jgi:hypothetical protein